ncbi:MAG: PAS domain-containing protein, partial [Firmicutes bacterium]|nr:PAS domain-containing protein [Bacillota bacterium]
RLPEPSEEDLQRILAAIGKREPSDELNCGACGYDSCRDKARAVYLGVAESEMCMPYMRAKAESLADVIITSTPNGIIVADNKLSILALNPAAESMFGCRALDLLHQPLAKLMPTDSFSWVLQHRQLIKESREYPEHGLIVRQYIFTPEDQDIVIGIFTDITAEMKQQDELDRLKATTLERAQEVINRQMRVAQEIAGLLGETTAETKVLLSQLMRLIQDGDNQ